MPLMVRGPGVPAGAVRQELVINNDFAPTIADLAGVPTPGFVDGSSFAPLLTGSPPSSWRTAFLEEGWLEKGADPNAYAQRRPHPGSHVHRVRRHGEHELYDLNADPYQLQSKPRAGNEQLYSDPANPPQRPEGLLGEGCRAAEWVSPAPPPPPPSRTPRPPRVRAPSPTPTPPGSPPRPTSRPPSQRT